MTQSGKTITAIIAEDEYLARTLLRKLLIAYPNIEVIGEATDGLKALNLIHEMRPDLVFLDIQMPELDGISVLKELDFIPMVVFTTAYQRYAVQAFDHHAVDYLLKPFDSTRFRKAIDRVLERRDSQKPEVLNIDQLSTDLDQPGTGSKSYWSRIIIKGKEGFIFVQVQDVQWIEAYSDYVKVHTKEKYYLKNMSMTEVEANLPPHSFIRIHRSTIVNRHFIKGLHPHLNGEYFITLANGQELKLSRSYKDKLPMLMEEKI